MKKIIIAAALLFGFTTVNAQTFDEGTSIIQAGISVWGTFGLPISASYEYGISEKIGVGVFAGYAGKTESVAFLGDVKYTYALFGVRGNYHFFQSDKIDAYGGLILGYNSASVTYPNGNGFPGYTPTASAVFLGGQIGGRYYFTDSFAAFAELGYGLGYLNVGLAYKL